jgi:hypothetical protein
MAISQTKEAILARQQRYNIAEQLEKLFDDIQAGHFGEQAKHGQFYKYIREIKEQFPK